MKNNADEKHQKAALIHTLQDVHQETVRRRYLKFRENNGVPERCDNPKCQFHKNELIWLGSKLKMVLDHIEGNRHDNSFLNLRFLCPNCDSQLSTRGGGSKGRIKYLDDYTFEVYDRKSKSKYTVYLPDNEVECLERLDTDDKEKWLSNLFK